MTTKTTKDWSEEEEDGDNAFSRGSITVRTPPKKNSTPTEVPMAPKKKETTLSLITSKPPKETDRPTTREPSTTTRGKTAKPTPGMALANNILLPTGEAALEMDAPRSPTRQQNTPTIEDTPPQATTAPLSGTVIPETPPNVDKTKEQKPEVPNMSRLLDLLIEAIGNIGNVKTNSTGPNATFVGKAKESLEKAKTITQNLLKEEENEKQQKIEQMSKDIKDIKRLLAKPTFAQVVATQPPMSSSGTPNNQRIPDTANDKTRKQQREKHTITITAATAPDTTKNQLKSMHAKDMIEKCRSAIAERFKLEEHTPKIHGINKLSNDEYRLHCESKEDPQQLRKMDWNLVFTTPPSHGSAICRYCADSQIVRPRRWLGLVGNYLRAT
jgi:hypothetical protein